VSALRPGASEGDRGAERRAEQRTERRIAAMFGIALLAGVVVLGVYLAGGQTQVEGILLAICLGGIGAGVIIWARRLLPSGLVIEERHPVSWQASPEAVRGIEAEEQAITRRRLLVGMLGGALAGLAAALAIPILSLGPAPGRSLFVTPWKSGLRLVGLDGQPVKAADIPLGGVLTVFPEGDPGSATGQALLLHVESELLDLPAGRADWAPGGYICYSKTCTHAGCSVGLYRAAEHRLICPCHQSTFDVLDGAIPTFGPAARPLPQLPIQQQADGTFVATGAFSGPIGPSFWNIESGA
jgi:ubiquinol-cytochrome c reductase iron-sulfur subunit